MTQPMTCDIAAPGPAQRVDYPPAVKAPSVADMTAARRRKSGDESKSPEVRPMNALARLIYRRKDELDLTWQELADKGGFPGHTAIYMLATKGEHRTPPRSETIKRLAKALEVPVDVVKQAAMEAAGLNTAEITIALSASEDVRIVASVMGELSEDDRQVLRDMAESLVRRNRERRKDTN